MYPFLLTLILKLVTKMDKIQITLFIGDDLIPAPIGLKYSYYYVYKAIVNSTMLNIEKRIIAELEGLCVNFDDYEISVQRSEGAKSTLLSTSKAIDINAMMIGLIEHYKRLALLVSEEVENILTLTYASKSTIIIPSDSE